MYLSSSAGDFPEMVSLAPVSGPLLCTLNNPKFFKQTVKLGHRVISNVLDVSAATGQTVRLCLHRVPAASHRRPPPLSRKGLAASRMSSVGSSERPSPSSTMMANTMEAKLLSSLTLWIISSLKTLERRLET